MYNGKEELFRRLAPLIGNTPLIEISFRYKGEARRVFAKAEQYNFTGSIKDRVAFHILQKAYEQGNIAENDCIVEATSGNTGIAFSAVGSYLGQKVLIYMPDWMSAERINLMKSYGAEVRLVSREEGGFLGSIQMTEELAAKGAVFLPRQFSNKDNVETHELTTGEEIAQQLHRMGLCADGIVAGVGTGGTVMGIVKRLQKDNPNCKGFPLEPLNSPTLSTGHKVGNHRIAGISDEFIPDIVKLDTLSDIIGVDDIDSILMAQMLSQKLGLGVGISSGANFLGCILAQEKLGKDSTIVTVFADDNKKYLSTDYAKNWEMQENYMTKNIELIGMTAIR